MPQALVDLYVRNCLGCVGLTAAFLAIVLYFFRRYDKEDNHQITSTDGTSDEDHEDECMMCGRRGYGKVCPYCIQDYNR